MRDRTWVDEDGQVRKLRTFGEWDGRPLGENTASRLGWVAHQLMHAMSEHQPITIKTSQGTIKGIPTKAKNDVLIPPKSTELSNLRFLIGGQWIQVNEIRQVHER